MNGAQRRCEEVSDSQVIGALLEGADSRTAINLGTGTNKYLCRPTPMPDMVCFASCTASPISEAGWAQARAIVEAFAAAGTAQDRSDILADQQARIVSAISDYFALDSSSAVLLCPSGTDALLTAALLLAEERPGEPVTAILPAAAETGTGVALATTCHRFDGAEKGQPLASGTMHTVEIALRDSDGTPRESDHVNEDYRRAMTTERGRALLIATHGTKTGLIAPLAPPPEAVDVIVDAAQTRLSPARVQRYLSLGWPVIVTGSKMLGGPAFSGAVLFPTARRPIGTPPMATIGTVLRWAATLDTMAEFAGSSARMAALLTARTTALSQALESITDVMLIKGPAVSGSNWDELPSILTFAVRDPARRGQLLTVTELQPLYQKLARAGCLLGQPVGLGAFGGLRVAVGARDLVAGAPPASRLQEALGAMTEPFAA